MVYVKNAQGEFPYKLDWGVRRKFQKEPLRAAKILLCNSG